MKQLFIAVTKSGNYVTDMDIEVLKKAAPDRKVLDRDAMIYALVYIAGTAYRVPRDARVFLENDIISLVWFE